MASNDDNGSESKQEAGNNNTSKPFHLNFKSKKKPAKEKQNHLKSTKKDVKEAFSSELTARQPPPKEESIREFNASSEASERNAPLVIPAVQNSFGRWSAADPMKKEEKGEDDEAILALQREAEEERGSSSTSGAEVLVIRASRDSFQKKAPQAEQERETQQFHSDLKALPDAMEVEDYHSSRIPIADFGAAMLRGMGWTGHADGDKKKDDSEPAMPRPHRLGLGATPKLAETDENEDGKQRRKPRTMDQYERDKKLKKQAQDFANQRQKQVKVDKQQTMQNGSLVLLKNGQRAKMVQLTGVPGLNQVRIQYESDPDMTTVKRGDVERLLTRVELEETPFLEPKEPQRPNDPGKSSSQAEGPPVEADHPRKRKRSARNDEGEKRRKGDRYSSTGHVRRDEEKKRSRRAEKSSSDRLAASWVIPQIRVRIITEKLGRRNYKKKGVVVDVTRKGSTVKLDEGGVVLDRVPDRYLETALPKPGGRAVVLKSEDGDREQLYGKGILLERGKGRGVVQLDSDKSVLTVSLDDVAEWVGPLDDE